MLIATINASEEQSHYVSQIYQEHYVALRRYFLMQLGEVSAAEDCVQETMRHFFFFMRERCWESEAENIPDYLMKIAGLLCSRKLAEKRAQHSQSLKDNENNLFNKFRTTVIQPLKECVNLRQLFLRPIGDSGR